MDLLEKYDPAALTTPANTFIDSMCGDGQFLVGIKNRKVKNNISESTAKNTLYGIDLTQSNIDVCIARTQGADTNIVCADSLGPTFTVVKKQHNTKKSKIAKLKNPSLIEID